MTANSRALAVAPNAKAWRPSMFGHERASVVNQPHELVAALASVVAKGLRR